MKLPQITLGPERIDEPGQPLVPQRRLLLGGWATAAVGLVLFAALVWVVRAFVTDDAYISLRYARNLAEGFGPVWNPGGPPAEGYSNPLLVFVEAAAFALGLDAALVARGLGVASGLGLVVLLWQAGRKVVGAPAAAAAALLVAASPALAYWAVGGLETLPMALVLAAASLELARPDGGSALRAGVLLALLPWLRPEGLALAGALVFFSEVSGLVDRDRRAATLRRLVWLAGLPLASQMGLEALRLAWYGHLLPNSVIYKTGTGRFAAVTYKFVSEAGPLLALAVAGFVLVPRRARLLAAPALTYLAMSLVFRDSVNTFSRLLLPTLPLFIVLAAAALPGATLRSPPSRRPLAALVVGTLALAGFLVVAAPVSILDAAKSAEGYARCQTGARSEAADWLEERADPDDVFAIGDAGLVPFYAGATAIDVFALNDPAIQETGALSATVRAQGAIDERPRFFVLASRDSEKLRALYGTDRRIAENPVFDDDYELQIVTGAADCGYYLFIYGRDMAATTGSR